jgi:hypothetical protein
MKINEKCPLFLNNILNFDIESCHYFILESLGYDVSDISKDNKIKRNISIGLLMKKYPNLINILRKITESIVNDFILKNKIREDDIVLRSYDGIITKSIKILDHDTSLKLRDVYINLIISSDRTNYLAINNKNEIIAKGISNKYNQINNFYSKLLKINFISKESIFRSLQRIRDELINNEDPEIFCIPIDDQYYEINLLKYGKMKISETVIQMIDCDDVNKEFYFDKYLKPFFDSIVIEFI